MVDAATYVIDLIAPILFGTTILVGGLLKYIQKSRMDALTSLGKVFYLNLIICGILQYVQAAMTCSPPIVRNSKTSSGSRLTIRTAWGFSACLW